MKNEIEKQVFITNHFENLFRSINGDPHQLLDVVSSWVTEEMNDTLLKEFTVEEVKQALDTIGDMKAPRHDGLPSIFYKQVWDAVGSKVCGEVMQVLNGGNMPDGWNDTIIALISKVEVPESMTELRPINLCNLLYNIVSKVLSNRLKIILQDIISPTQSTFVPGHLISDNILTAYEMTHYLKNKREGNVRYAAIKLDMSKSYDRVEWSFLRDIMLKIGFSTRWVELIMKCVTSVTYNIKITTRGSTVRLFVPIVS